MEAETIRQRKAHLGQNVKRLRKMLGIKQTLADGLGLSQQTISRIESQEELWITIFLTKLPMCYIFNLI